MSRCGWLFRILQVLILLAVASSFAHADNHMYFKKKGASAGGGGVTYLDSLACEDNAATNDVANTGTRATVWDAHSALDFTSELHSVAQYKDGAASFLFDNPVKYLSTANFNTEKFELKFWWQPINASAGGHEILAQVGAWNGPNWICLLRLDSTDDFRVAIQGNNVSATAIGRNTTNFAPSAGTWYLIKLNVDASGTTWVISLSWSTNGTDFTSGTFDGTDWNTGYVADWTSATGYIAGNAEGAYSTDAYIDAITVQNLE